MKIIVYSTPTYPNCVALKEGFSLLASWLLSAYRRVGGAHASGAGQRDGFCGVPDIHYVHSSNSALKPAC